MMMMMMVMMMMICILLLSIYDRHFNLLVHANNDLMRCVTATSGNSFLSKASRLTDDKLGKVSSSRPNLAVVADTLDEVCACDGIPDDAVTVLLDDVRDVDGGDCACAPAC